MIALILTAQLLATAPQTTTAAPIVRADTGQTRTLADVARERKLGKKGVVGGTLSVAGAPVPRANAVVLASAPLGADEAEWTRRNAESRGELSDAHAALAQADANLPRWSVTGRGSAYTAAMLDQMRENALLPYRTRAAEAQAKVDALPEAARKAGAQPGWVRPTTSDDAFAQQHRKVGLAEQEKQLNNGDAPLPNRDRDIMPDGSTSRVEK